jgi:formylglycine-generating enzyme required for sulfatase activity
MTVAGWALAAAVLAFGSFVFTARSVRVEIEPSPDRVWFEGGLVRLGLAERYLLRPGPYVVRAEKAGYQPLEASVEVTEAAHQVLSFELAKLPGSLAIDVGGVIGASVLVDGEAVGETPLAPLELPPGEHALIVRSERYQELATKVTIEGGGQAQSLKLELVPNWAEITFDSKPQGAQIRVDGQAVGETPLTAELLAGVRAVELVRPGWKPYAKRLKVVAGEAQTLPSVRLQPADGNLVVSSEPPGATVEVDGSFRGRTPLDLKLAPGRGHELRVSRLGYDSQSLEVSLAPKQSKTLSVKLVPRLGEVRIEALPADSELWVDGQPRGRATQVLQLTAEPHDIEIRREGHQSHRQRVTPRPGFPQSLRVRLESLDRAKVATETLPRRITNSEGLELRLIEGGRFRMGAPRREPGRRANESLREVALTRPFYLSTTEISNQQFRRFKSTHLSGQVSGANLEIDHHPVVRVTWAQAVAYCNWLSAKESLPPAYLEQGGRWVATGPLTTGYRLPTEAEWAWAARYPDGRTALKYPWGQSLPIPPRSGNYADASARGVVSSALPGYDDRYPATAPVDAFSPNALGLFNMGGNVAEWVHDLYAIRPVASGEGASDPTGPTRGTAHVIRGSSWMDAAATRLRLSYRDFGNGARPDVGFRVARYAR